MTITHHTHGCLAHPSVSSHWNVIWLCFHILYMATQLCKFAALFWALARCYFMVILLLANGVQNDFKCFYLLSYLIRVAKGQKSNTNHICLFRFVRFPKTSPKQSCVSGFKRRPIFLQCAHGRLQKWLHLLCPLPTHSDYPTETAYHSQRAGQ